MEYATATYRLIANFVSQRFHDSFLLQVLHSVVFLFTAMDQLCLSWPYVYDNLRA